jgi:hypothetical protein
MSPLRGLMFLVCVVPTACAVGYKYSAPKGAAHIDYSYLEPTLVNFIILGKIFSHAPSTRRERKPH